MSSTMLSLLLLATSIVVMGHAKILFFEGFDKGWEKRWVMSNWKKDEGMAGKWATSHGTYYGDAKEDKGAITTKNAKFYAMTSKMDETYTNQDGDLVVQYSVKLPKGLDCAGGYIKLLRAGADQEEFGGSSDYAIMFGPDICGSATRKTHLIINYKGENVPRTNSIAAEFDYYTHFYTLIIRKDNTYAVLIDNIEKASGNLADDFALLPPEEIQDPKAKKPKDWVDEAEWADPEDEKPNDWVDIKTIPDDQATKPDDWDDDADGDWTPPEIPNPEFKGEWAPRQVPNPKYKGEWVHPMIPNPEYVNDPSLYVQKSIQFVGFELWQMTSGTIFDNIMVTDKEQDAFDFLDKWLSKNKKAERKMKDAQDADERKKLEAERKAAEGISEEEEEEEVEDIDEDDDDKEEL